MQPESPIRTGPSSTQDEKGRIEGWKDSGRPGRPRMRRRLRPGRGGRNVAQFLRDEHVANLTINESTLEQVNAVLEVRRASLSPKPNGTPTDQAVFLTYIIRFDNKGYRVFSLPKLLEYFHQAKYVERIIATLETSQSLQSSRMAGTYLELRLDEKDPNNCSISVTSDNGDWVDSSFSAIKEVLSKCGNKSAWARSAWTLLGIQITGVTFGFLISLWAALRISPHLAIENSFLISFIFVLLVFSNTWTHINQRLIALVNYTFPNLKFYRPTKDRIHWLLQALIGGIAVAITLFVLNFLFSYFGQILGELATSGS